MLAMWFGPFEKFSIPQFLEVRYKKLLQSDQWLLRTYLTLPNVKELITLTAFVRKILCSHTHNCMYDDCSSENGNPFVDFNEIANNFYFTPVIYHMTYED